MDVKLFDPAEILTSEERIIEYLREAFEDGDPALITMALGAVARARSMAEVAGDTGLTREALYKALSRKGNPRLSTFMAVIKALGYRLSIDARPP
jgi:probable addiction module antidote protein